MKLLEHLGESLLHPEQLHSFLPKAETLFRRSLRIAHLRNAQHDFPPDIIAICVFAHLSAFSLETVYQACSPDMFRKEDGCSPVKNYDNVKRVWREGWEPAASELKLDKSSEGDEEAEKGMFSGYEIFFVPSLFFSKRLAAFLFKKVGELGGSSTIVSRGEQGFREVAEHLKKARRKSKHAVLCTDMTVVKRLSHLLDIPCLPHKWLSDSIRDQRIKSFQAYGHSPTKALITSPVTPSTPATRTNHDSPDANYGIVDEIQSRKKMKQDNPDQKSITSNAADNLRKKLFQTPVKRGPRLQVENETQSPSKKLKWACEVRTSFHESPFPMNDKICELLGIVQESYAIKKDHFHVLGYQKAVSKIRSLDYELLTKDDARRAGNENAIGEKIERKIVEIVKTGRLLQAEAVLENMDNKIVKEFCDIWGVGPVKAMHLVAQGIKSIAQLREEVKKRPHLLDKNQTIGLTLYEDLLHRIPREEVADLEMYVRKVVKKIDSTLDITVAGSYLRGKASCGDVDIMIHGNEGNLRNAFAKVSSTMKKSGILTHDLIDGPDKYFGVFKFPGRRHGRVDLFAVPNDQYPYALLTYTGSAIFNRFVSVHTRSHGITV